MTKTGRLELSSGAQDYVGTLIAASVDRMEQEGRLDDAQAVADAEAAFRTLIRGAYRASASGREEKRAGYQIDEGNEHLISQASITTVLKGICPLWPIC